MRIVQSLIKNLLPILAALMPVTVVQAESVRLAAATPMVAFADPLAIDGGNGVISSVFDGLTSMGIDNDVEPALALSWTVTSDTTWEFKLRPDVVFHDGTAFNAQSVIDYFEFMSRPEAAAYAASLFTRTVERVRAIDDLTVELTTRSPDPILDRRLTRAKLFPVAVIDRVGRSEFGRSPVGTGPYAIGSWSRGGAAGVTLVGQSSSWRAPEQIMEAEYVILPDATSRVQSLLSGNVDIANAIEPDALPALEAEGFGVHVLVSPIVLSLSFNTCDGTDRAVSDPRVRRALNISFDREAMIGPLSNGLAPIAHQGGAPGVFGHNDTISPYRYDPEAARALLSASGAGDTLPLRVGVFVGQFPSDALIFQQLAQSWAQIGIQAELQQLAFAEYLRRVAGSDWEDFDLFASVWSHYQFGDVSDTLARHAGLHPSPYFCAPELHEDIERADQEMDPEARERMLKELMARLHELQPSVPLSLFAGINVYSPRVELYKMKTDAILFGEMRMAVQP